MQDSPAMQAALARIAALEAELNDRDQQLESVIMGHDKDIVDLRKSFEMEAFRKPPLHPGRMSVESVRLSQDDFGTCKECERMKKQIRIYQKQWREMSKHFKHVPALLEGMIQKTDTLVNNITQIK